MINNIELQEKLQAEAYKIITESINEEEMMSMGLKKEQIIPTITFFRDVQKQLVLNYFEHDHDGYYGKGYATFYFRIESEDDIDYLNISENNILALKEKKINFSFLNALCESADINFTQNKNLYYFECDAYDLETDIQRKYHI